MGVKVWLYLLICRTWHRLERANGYRLYPGIPPSPLLQAELYANGK